VKAGAPRGMSLSAFHALYVVATHRLARGSLRSSLKS
jgi:hypothetical protein